MEMRLEDVDNAEEAMQKAETSSLRFFKIERSNSSEPLDDCVGKWQGSTAESARDFSAIGYFYGKQLHEKLGVPVGMIQAAWGGTRIEAWTKKEVLENLDIKVDMILPAKMSQLLITQYKV